MLRTENIVKRFGTHTALDGVSMEVPAGQTFGLLGPNGADKTTLIRIITRITAADAGRVWINDTQYFDGVPEVAWDFHIGGYQPARKWLKDRHRRTLTFETSATTSA